MKLFNFLTQEIAIDLGTANTIIMHNDKVVVDQPSMVAINKSTGKVIAIGEKAQQMQGKEHKEIEVVKPLKDGVIANFNAAENMIKGMIGLINESNNFFFPPNFRMVICIPSGITEVELRAVIDSAERAGGKEVKLIFEPMAAAIGIGIDVKEPEGNMIVDIGGGTTEIAVIALSGLVSNESIRLAGDQLTKDIVDYMKTQHNLNIGEPTAELVKKNVGSCLALLDNPPPDYPVQGRDNVMGIPKQIVISYSEIAAALDKSIQKIEESILKALDLTPPELAADIFRTGIYLTGGGALLRGLDKRLGDKTKLKVHVADDPLLAVARGTNIALKNMEKFASVLK
ncbi:MAG: rod shape-determining protein [Chitinophagales bacterium]|jgi:rod shape-determining protein MreB|nr:rod shape-determining protein [Chitinophagales bacterium]